jgi:hypothetical protein
VGYSRLATSSILVEGDELTAAMVGIGMMFGAAAPAHAPNIEDTLLAASIEGMDRDDLRVLAVLVTWLGAHHPRINADRLIRAVLAHPSDRVGAFWAGIGEWLAKDRRLARLCQAHPKPRIDLLRTGTDFQIGRRGEDQRFRHGPLRVPAGVLRDRPADILDPQALAKRHDTYCYRVLMGPTYRADMWALLDREPSLSASELARKAYGSFATAWQVKHDRALIGGGQLRPGRPLAD